MVAALRVALSRGAGVRYGIANRIIESRSQEQKKTGHLPKFTDSL
jgi:hypothetical protein